MRGSLGLGLLIGLVVGAGAMYLGLERPWVHHGGLVPPDGPSVVVVQPDAPVKAKPRHPRHNAGGLQVAPDPGDDQAPAPVLTAADHELEWRGDTVALPPQTIDLANGGAESRSLDDGEIANVLDRQSQAIQDCVVKGATDTDLRGTITVKLLVDGTGKVTKSRVQAPHYLLSHGLYECTQRALGHVRFPATGAPTVVTLPVTLS
ncbi:MAG TPA: AgmX/PglI C-terminal domain-containing protein [Kofleriaceae bacterium]